MALSREMRLLQNKWKSGQGWPKRLDWIEIEGIRGWTGQRIDLDFPIVALVGENGVGKSTVLQAAVASYRSENGGKNYFASDFFPDTPWEVVTGATIRTAIREGAKNQETTVRKPSGRWRGNPERRSRSTTYIDLRRIQPISARTGYARIAKPQVKVTSSVSFDQATLNRLSQVMGKKYEVAGLALTDMDETRQVPVVRRDGTEYSGFHGGAGETAMAELLPQNFGKYSLICIDEIETSLHPSVQRRLIRDLAEICRETESQMILTTHSPYVLSELPTEARVYITGGAAGKNVIKGVSPDFAMSKMDEELHPEADLYVEDGRAADLLREILVSVEPDLVGRVQIIPFGAASVGLALGQMVSRFPRPSVVFLDGDQVAGVGCKLLPGQDAPERVVFDGLRQINWEGLDQRIGRPISDVIDVCSAAMTLGNHHDWLTQAANRLVVGSSVLWPAMCAIWVSRCMAEPARRDLVDTVRLALSPS